MLAARSRWQRKHLILERLGCVRSAKVLHHGSMKDSKAGLSMVSNMTYAFGQTLHGKGIVGARWERCEMSGQSDQFMPIIFIFADAVDGEPIDWFNAVSAASSGNLTVGRVY